MSLVTQRPYAPPTPSRIAAASTSSISRVARLVPAPAAAGFALSRWMGAALNCELGGSRAIGDGGTVDTGRGESEGAGMTVTTGVGDGCRVLLGDGVGGLGPGLGLSGADDLVGDGSGGMMPVGDGDGDGSARPAWLGLTEGLGLTDGLGLGDGVGAADAGDPMTTAGSTATATRPSSTVRRLSATC